MSRTEWRLCTAIIIVLLGHVVLAGQPLLEDAYISFRYAENLASGHGFRFNPGEAPVEGFSNLLWVMLLSLGDFIGLSAVHTGRWVGLLSMAAALGCVLATGKRMGLRPWWFPGLLMAVSYPVAFHAGNGLETSATTMLMSALLLSLVSEEAPGSPGGASAKAAARSGLLASLLVLSRPEAPLVLALLGLGRWLDRGSRDRWVPALCFHIPWTVTLVALWSVKRLYFGAALPNTYYLKVVRYHPDLLARWLEGLQYSLLFFILCPLFLALLGLIVLRPLPRHTPVFLGGWLGVATFLALSGGEPSYVPYWRLYLPAFPCLFVLVGIVVDRLHTRLATPLLMVAMLFLLGLSQLVQSHVHYGFGRGSISPGVRNLKALIKRPPGEILKWVGRVLSDYDSTRYSYDSMVARRLRDTFPKDHLLASPQAGKLAYVWRGPFLDLEGLMDSTIVHIDDSTPDGALRLRGYLRRRAPDLILLWPEEVARFTSFLVQERYGLYRYFTAGPKRRAAESDVNPILVLRPREEGDLPLTHELLGLLAAKTPGVIPRSLHEVLDDP